ncbi:MAG: hypothetical protein ACRDNW_18355 [Trebonia sp.]
MVEVVGASTGDRTVVRRLLQFYHYDFSEFDDADVDPHGEFLHRYLATTGPRPTARRSCSASTVPGRDSPWYSPAIRTTSPSSS